MYRNLTVRAHSVYNRIIHRTPNRYGRLKLEALRAKPRIIVEIGLWKGDRSVELIDAALRSHPASEIRYFGFDMFETMPETSALYEVSHKSKNPTLAEVRARLEGRAQINLTAGNSLQTLPKAKLPPIDFAFIDGGHSYGTVKSDWENIARLLHPGSVVIFDDYVNEAAIRAEGFGTNKLIDEIDRNLYRVEPLSPVDWWAKPWGFMTSRLVKVTQKSSIEDSIVEAP